MSLVENTGYKITRRVLILTLIISGIFFFVFPNPKEYVLGLVFGAIINLLNFRLMTITLSKSVNMSQRQIMPYVIGNYGLRYIIYGTVLVVGAVADYLNFYTVVLGVFMVKIVIISDSFYDMIRKDK